MLRRFLLYTLITVSLATIVYTKQDLVIESKISDSLLIQHLKPLDQNLIKPFLLGHEGFYADVIWIDTIQKSVDHETPNLANYIYQTVDLITDLDPRFLQVYIWSNSAIEFSNPRTVKHVEKIKMANKILEKGWNYVLKDAKGWNYFRMYWMIPQFLGYNYGIVLKNKDKALEYTQALMNVPGLPAYMKTWAAGLYRESSDKTKGIDYLETLFAAETLRAQLAMTDDQLVKDRLQGKLLAFYRKLHTDAYGVERIENIRKEVESTVNGWREKYFFIPFDLYALAHSRKENVSNSEEIYGVFFPSLWRYDD